MNDHLFAQENLGDYLAGGLSAEERGQLESHVKECPECAAESCSRAAPQPCSLLQR